MVKILFACTGNTCRSPMAEAFFNAMAVKDGKEEDFHASSAGIAAADGEPASRQALSAMALGFGIHIGGHRSRSFDRAVQDAPDLILTMTEAQKREVCRLYPDLKGRVHALKAYAGSADGAAAPANAVGGNTADAVTASTNTAAGSTYACGSLNEPAGGSIDISDPYGYPAEVYERCAGEIKCAVEKLYRHLVSGSRK